MPSNREKLIVRGNLTERDLRMFDLVCKWHDLRLVGGELSMSEDAINQRFYWIRKKRKQWQRNVNILNSAEKKCKRLEKLLTPKELKK